MKEQYEKEQQAKRTKAAESAMESTTRSAEVSEVESVIMIGEDQPKASTPKPHSEPPVVKLELDLVEKASTLRDDYLRQLVV